MARRSGGRIYENHHGETRPVTSDKQGNRNRRRIKTETGGESTATDPKTAEK
jgi:hypothetical protein